VRTWCLAGTLHPSLHISGKGNTSTKGGAESRNDRLKSTSIQNLVLPPLPETTNPPAPLLAKKKKTMEMILEKCESNTFFSSKMLKILFLKNKRERNFFLGFSNDGSLWFFLF